MENYENNQEEMEDIVPSLQLKMTDDELLKTINKLLSESEENRKNLKKEGEDNENYWKGDQLNTAKMFDYQSKIVDNRLFMSAETIIPIMTSRTPEPTIRLKDDQLREDLKQILMNLWEVPTDDDSIVSMQANMEMISRHWMIYKLGMLYYWYDNEIDDIRTTYVHPDELILDGKARSWNKSRFVARYCSETLEDIKKMWPKKADEINKLAGNEAGASMVRYLEFWTPDYVCYKYQNIILEKKKNPNFDYGDMGSDEESGRLYNFFRKSRLPFIPLTVFNLGKGIADDTSLIEQGKRLQDAINKRKNQISDSASDNGVLAGSGDFVDKKVLESYTGSPKEKIWIKSGDVRQALTRLPPKDLAPYVYQDLIDSKSEIDNIFGSHDTTRGEGARQKTLGEARLLRMGDLGRIDLFSRALDRVAQEWYAAMFHMCLVFKTSPVEINSNDEDNTSIVFDRDEYFDEETGKIRKTIIKVKGGSSMSIDKDARRAEAIQLAQANLIDPITFFERMDYANPKEMAYKLFLWTTNPIALFPEEQAAEQAKQQQQMAQQAEVEANTPIAEGTPINLPGGETVTPEQPANPLT